MELASELWFQLSPSVRYSTGSDKIDGGGSQALCTRGSGIAVRHCCLGGSTFMVIPTFDGRKGVFL